MAFEFWEVHNPTEGQGPDRIIAIERALAVALAMGRVTVCRLEPNSTHRHKIEQITGPRELRIVVASGGLAVGSLIGAAGRYDFVMPHEEAWMDLSLVESEANNYSVVPHALIRDTAHTPELTSLRALHDIRFRRAS